LEIRAENNPMEKENAMKIAVTTPTGHVGRAVMDFLLDSGDGVRVKMLCRRAKDLSEFVDRGAELALGSQDDADYLIRATRDIDALFWVTPPGYGSDNLRAYQNRLGRAAAETVRTNRIGRVVNLSSIGAELESGAGPISGLGDVEKMLNRAATHITHLRPGFFFENLLWQQDSLRRWGRFSITLSGARAYPMIDTRDVGRAAADRLMSESWTGQNVQELHGPADLSFNDVAGILSRVLNRKIVYVQGHREEVRRHLIESSMSENAADALLEMYDAVESGKIHTLQPRSRLTTTTTTLETFARNVLLPLMAESVVH
jgi:uncharacterized protein YbjT (DUF2867 family)